MYLHYFQCINQVAINFEHFGWCTNSKSSDFIIPLFQKRNSSLLHSQISSNEKKEYKYSKLLIYKIRETWKIWWYAFLLHARYDSRNFIKINSITSQVWMCYIQRYKDLEASAVLRRITKRGSTPFNTPDYFGGFEMIINLGVGCSRGWMGGADIIF